jgi:UDP-N-acetylmuramate dehydrogenase
MHPSPSDWRHHLPPVRGKIRLDADLSATNWFRVGGPAEVLFRPGDTDDLAAFLRALPREVPVTVLGVGSNLIIRDGGIPGVVVRLGKGFLDLKSEGPFIRAGAGLLCAQLSDAALQAGLTGLEFLSGVPGSIGGALAMNAGAYGSDVACVLVEVEAVTLTGEIRRYQVDELLYSYRHCNLHTPVIFTAGWFAAQPGDPATIAARMQEIGQMRETTQPVRLRTGGSTFQNPDGMKAWELIDRAGCRGLTLGGAQVSELHCNFLINTGTATAADLEDLGEEVRRRVHSTSGVWLDWEIKRIGVRT